MNLSNWESENANPFGYRGTYELGVEDRGVKCGGPNNFGGLFYDADDGRSAQSEIVAAKEPFAGIGCCATGRVPRRPT